MDGWIYIEREREREIEIRYIHRYIHTYIDTYIHRERGIDTDRQNDRERET